MRVLTINSGSSSLKFAVYDLPDGEQVALTGSIERIGLAGGRLVAKDGGGRVLIDEPRDLATSAAALDTLIAWLQSWLQSWLHAGRRSPLDAIGHRIVHGGARHTRPERITPALVEALRALVPLAPAHLPAELEAIAAASAAYPDLPQVACFDTAFHRNRPLVGQVYGLPWALYEGGVLRYGFHGLSLEYILRELARVAGPEVAAGRLVVAHLGNGSSMAAILGGRSMDATMGFTPLGGLVMSTRPGDLDPGVLLYLLEERGLSPAALRTMLGAESGLLGVSGLSSDMRDLLARERDDPRAALAIDLYCFTARKSLGALAAVLGGLETLVFTAGIGEHAAPIRERICAELGFLGIRLDTTRNAANAPIISPDGGPVTVRVMPTNEELMIARHTAAVLGASRSAAPKEGSHDADDDPDPRGGHHP